jgi:hypothetical protein
MVVHVSAVSRMRRACVQWLTKARLLDDEVLGEPPRPHEVLLDALGVETQAREQ